MATGVCNTSGSVWGRSVSPECCAVMVTLIGCQSKRWEGMWNGILCCIGMWSIISWNSQLIEIFIAMIFKANILQCSCQLWSQLKMNNQWQPFCYCSILSCQSKLLLKDWTQHDIYSLWWEFITRLFYNVEHFNKNWS